MDLRLTGPEREDEDYIPPYTQLTLEYPQGVSQGPQYTESAETLFLPSSRGSSPAQSVIQQVLNAGGTLVGKILYDAFGRVLGQLVDTATGKAVELVSEMPNRKPGRKNAPVKKTPARKGKVTQTRAPSQPVYTQPRAVSAPVNVSRRVNVRTKPKMGSGSKGLVVTHREMIGQIISSATNLAYSTDSFVINPGKFSTFPWLSTLAVNFDKYVMKRLRFYTISNQATTVAGRVGLGYDVDSTDTPPQDRNEFFSLTYHAECAPWDSVVLDIPCDNKERFVNSHTTTDSKLIDIGQIIFMSDAISASGVAQPSTALSDVIVEYTVELIDPQQAVYSTQLFQGTGAAISTLDKIPTYGPVVVQPAGAESGFTYTSTSTILYLKALQGYYYLALFTRDNGGGTPTIDLAVHGGTGFARGTGTANDNMAIAAAKITTNDAYFRITLGGVTITNLDALDFAITRIPAQMYVKAGSTLLGGAAMTTF